jgi:hypothetical protein
MRPDEVPIDPDCGRQHLGRCGGVSFASRLASVSADADASPTRTRRSYYDDDLIRAQTGWGDRKERVADLMDATSGYSYGETQPDGSVVGRDPKTKERRTLTPTEVNQAYLSGGTGA